MAVATRGDEEIRKDVLDQLHRDGRVDASGISVEVSDARVVLTGTVSTYSARTRAEEDAWMVVGVDTVDNQLTVKYPADVPVPTDEEIESNVVNTLRWQTDVDLADVEVAVKGGRVTLKGSVDFYWKKVWIEEITGGLPGVTHVTNELAVVPSHAFDDLAIAEEIEGALERNLREDAEKVDVKVEDGVVTLTGHVPHIAALHAARDVARHTPGVVSIVNKLTVG